MIATRTRHSIVFQLWIRLSAITVSFTLLALSLYVWLEIGDSVSDARDQAVVRADVVASAVARLGSTGSQPTAEEQAVAATLGVKAIQFLGMDGSVTAALGDQQGTNAYTPAETANGLLAVERGYHVKVTDDDFRRFDVGALDLLQGGRYGAVLVYPLPSALATDDFAGLRVMVEYQGIAGAAQTLLFRTLALTSAILAVAVIAMWLLLNRFVAKPLKAYSATAHRIAAGERLRMPEEGNNELGQLGQAINGMADILLHQASMDSLTGLYNVRHLTSRLEPIVDEARKRSEPLSVLVVDLDDLKPVNDTYGHHVGDLLLKATAHQLLSCSSMEFTSWRTGGDEFAIVMPGADAERAQQMATSLSQALSSAAIPVPNGEVPISASIGVASYPEDGTSGSALMNIADLRMYESKSHKDKPRMPTPAA